MTWKPYWIFWSLKNGQDADIPGHEVYDIVPGEKQRVKAADFVIVEGIMSFKILKTERLYITDFFDFSIYRRAAVEDIESFLVFRPLFWNFSASLKRT